MKQRFALLVFNHKDLTRIEVCTAPDGQSMFMEDFPSLSADTVRLVVEHAGWVGAGEVHDMADGWWQTVAPLCEDV